MDTVLTASDGVKAVARGVFNQRRKELVEGLKMAFGEEYGSFATEALSYEVIVPDTNGLELSGRVNAMVRVEGCEPTSAGSLTSLIKARAQLWAMGQSLIPIVEPVFVIGGAALTESELRGFFGISRQESPRLEGGELIETVDELFKQAKGDLLDKVASHLASVGEPSGDLPCLLHVVGWGLGYLPMVIPAQGWEGHSNPVGELVLVPTFAGVHDAGCLPSCKGGRPKYEPLLEKAVRDLLPVKTGIEVGQYEGVIATPEYHDARKREYAKWCGQVSEGANECAQAISARQDLEDGWKGPRNGHSSVDEQAPPDRPKE